MMIQGQHPTTVFLNETKAAELVAKLNAEAATDGDGWTYEIKCRVPGKFVIAINDGDGEFIGYL